MFEIIAGLFEVVDYCLSFALLLLFASAVLRLVGADERNGLVRAVHGVCDPLTRRVSRRFPGLIIRSQGGYLDLSPTVLMLAIGAVKVFLPYLRAALLKAL